MIIYALLPFFKLFYKKSYPLILHVHYNSVPCHSHPEHTSNHRNLLPLPLYACVSALNAWSLHKRDPKLTYEAWDLRSHTSSSYLFELKKLHFKVAKIIARANCLCSAEFLSRKITIRLSANPYAHDTLYIDIYEHRARYSHIPP